jgi:hypothetical protein
MSPLPLLLLAALHILLSRSALGLRQSSTQLSFSQSFSAPNQSSLPLPAASPAPYDNVYSWGYAANAYLKSLRADGMQVLAAASSTVVALERKCGLAGANSTSATADLASCLVALQGEIVSLASYRAQATALLSSDQASLDRNTQVELEYAASSIDKVKLNLYKLADVAAAVGAASNVSDTCALLFNPGLESADLYAVETAQPESSVFRIVTASLGGALGLVLLVLPPVNFTGTRAGICLSMMYAWGLVGFTIAWFCFDMNSVSKWATSAWWKDLYAVYGIGLLAAVVSLFPSICLPDVAGGVAAMYVGLGAGVVFGVQANTVGMWMLQPTSLPAYVTLVVCMAASALLFCAVWSIWFAALRSPNLAPAHLASCWIGGWLFVHMIGVLVGNFPSVFAMARYDWTTTVYIVSMWVCTALAFVCQWFLYGIGARVEPAGRAGRKPKADSQGAAADSSSAAGSGSRWSSASGAGSMRRRRVDDDESKPLLGEGGSSMHSGEPEFGGIRASLFGGGGSERFSAKR